jgi:isopentenyl-diphosphate delta-isomerase
MQEIINLVNTNGEVIGAIEKLEAHEKGLLHEAFSIFIFNTDKELLLQRRAVEKYHSGGLWTNTCCSHPRAGEDLQKAVHRRMIEEMGFDVEYLKKVYSFIYNVSLDKGLIEHEYDHVLVGEYSEEIIQPNPEEVCEYKWVSVDWLKRDADENPTNYTEWIKIILKDEKFLTALGQTS